MSNWLRRLRAGLFMGVTWAFGWAMIGGLIELVTNFVPGWNGALVDMWPQTLAVPGFLGGVLFSGVLGVAGRRRRFDELSLPTFAAWGALGGVLLASPFVTLAGFTLPSLVVGTVVTALCAASASAVLAVARSASDPDALAGPGGPEPRDLIDTGEHR